MGLAGQAGWSCLCQGQAKKGVGAQHWDSLPGPRGTGKLWTEVPNLGATPGPMGGVERRKAAASGQGELSQGAGASWHPSVRTGGGR